VDTDYSTAGGLQAADIEPSTRKVYLLQRKAGKVGEGLGKTTGWIHRTSLKNRAVEMLNGVTYRRIDDAGLHITVGDQDLTIPADTVVVCAGQEPQRELQETLVAAGCTVHLIGGADKAVELDAKQAIKQGTELALSLGNRIHSAPTAAAPAGLQLLPAVAESLALWHAMIGQADMGELGSILHPKAVFRSPVAHTPYASAPVVQLFLTAASQVFEDFVYHRELAGADGTSVMLEFSAKVNGKALKGIDLIQFDAEGRIVDFEVMVRPMSGLQALADEMGKRMAPYMAAFKAPR